jgi:hypothetical protein
MSILKQVDYCPECGETWDPGDQPGDCCGVPPITGYACPDCGVGAQTEAEAIACCNWDCTPEGYRLIHAAAAAAGQQELLLTDDRERN